jgi:GNAT superfamily N-acetyltransferase
MTFKIRHANTNDISALAALHVQTFNETHLRGGSGGPSYELREHQWTEAFADTGSPWFCFVIENESGELMGFAKGTRHDGGVPGFVGELNKIYVLRRYHRKGLGRLLLCKVARQFLGEGVVSMLLFGDAQSPANGFYEAFGAERLYSDRGEFHGGYGWRDLSALADRCEGVDGTHPSGVPE